MGRSVVVSWIGWLAWASIAWAQDPVICSLDEPPPDPRARILFDNGKDAHPVKTLHLPEKREELAEPAGWEESQKPIQLPALESKKVDQEVQEINRLNSKLDSLQYQTEIIQKQFLDLMKEVSISPTLPAQEEKKEKQLAPIEPASTQAAFRDLQLAGAIDELREQADVERRYGPRLPEPLKELFLPSQTNETSLSIYGVLAGGYSKIDGQPGGFFFGEFSPQFLLQLNDWIQLEAEIKVGPEGKVDARQAQADFIANDWFTVVAGRFLAPLGFFNERLDQPWINKLPDAPLMFRQVSPGNLSLIGVQIRGGHYLGRSPYKLEYSGIISNGLETRHTPTPTTVANLEGLEDTYQVVTNDPAVGGRVGLWIPEIGVTAGLSGFLNGGYTPTAGDNIRLWQADAGYHKGNWDLRFEYAQMSQQALSYIGNNIHRQGVYGQVAFRPLDATCKYVRQTEMVFRYSYTQFEGIDPTTLDLTAFVTPIDVPVNRHQYTAGINYYFYPSLLLKVAYEVNNEPAFALNDNAFLAQLAWGF